MRNNGGGHWNHSMFWKWMAPNAGGAPTGKAGDAITSSFGSFDKFKEEWGKAGVGRFGSGWVWLLKDGGKLWIAWPKQTSGVKTDVTQPAIREFGLAAGWVDFKICAIDETWSGLAFSRRNPKAKRGLR